MAFVSKYAATGIAGLGAYCPDTGYVYDAASNQCVAPDTGDVKQPYPGPSPDAATLAVTQAIASLTCPAGYTKNNVGQCIPTASALTNTWIPGISNMTVAIGGSMLFAVLLFALGGRR